MCSTVQYLFRYALYTSDVARTQLSRTRTYQELFFQEQEQEHFFKNLDFQEQDQDQELDCQEQEQDQELFHQEQEQEQRTFFLYSYNVYL